MEAFVFLMPYSDQDVVLSGQSEIAEQARVYITYNQKGMLGYQDGQFDMVPGFIYLGGRVRHRKDNQGNLISENY